MRGINESYLFKSSNSLVDQVQECLEESSLRLECPIASAKTSEHSVICQLHEVPAEIVFKKK